MQKQILVAAVMVAAGLVSIEPAAAAAKQNDVVENGRNLNGRNLNGRNVNGAERLGLSAPVFDGTSIAGILLADGSPVALDQ